MLCAGWDVGGAHLKLAVAEGSTLVSVVERPCPLWLGLDRLHLALAGVAPMIARVERHAVTMTGELVDLFADRRVGVGNLVEAMVEALGSEGLRFFTGHDLVGQESALERWAEVASANWLATARYVARARRQALLLDVGSTTSDIVVVDGGEVRFEGRDDAGRLASGELVYSGVTRTPVMAVAERVPFAGVEQRLMAELFATMADVYLLTGALAADADPLPPADQGERSVPASEARLARMLGRDRGDAEPAAWRRLARHLAERQLQGLHLAAERILSRGQLAEDAPLVGAGLGRFLVRELAARLERPYSDLSLLLSGDLEVRDWAARCAPAAVLALAAAEDW